MTDESEPSMPPVEGLQTDAPLASEPAHSAPQERPSYDQLMQAVESAPNEMDLMAAVNTAERHIPTSRLTLFNKAYERALGIGDKETALMYGNRITAEIMLESVRSMHNAAQGMMDSAMNHRTASETMKESADLMHRTAHPEY